jgi:glutamyl-tRNA(Gln) amidotransferase subunit E
MARVVDRANAALEGVPEETRDPRPDGTTVYSRPLPGRARMYVETDVPPVRITAQRLGALGSRLPEAPEERLAKYVARFKIHRQQMAQILEEGREELFEKLAEASRDPGLAARTLLNTLPELAAQGLPVGGLGDEQLEALHRAYGEGRFPREAIPIILGHLLTAGGTVEESIAAQGLGRADRREVQAVVDQLLREKAELVAERGEGALGPLMGLAMERLKGRAEGKLISEVLKERLRGRRKER